MFVSRSVEKLVPYVYGIQPRPVPGLVKLNTNENPYPTHPAVRKLLSTLDLSRLRLYPDPLCQGLRKTSSKVFGIPEDYFLFGNGSDEIIAMIFRVFFNPGERVLFTQYTYSAYRSYADAAGVASADLPMGPDFRIDLGRLRKRTEKVFFLTNPNAPTGIALSASEIENVVSLYPKKLFVVDEAYADFAGDTCLPLTKRFSNLMVLRTLSKSYSLCGIRLGFAAAQPALIQAMTKVKDPYNVNLLTQLVGELAIRQTDHHLKNVKKVVVERERFKKALEEMGYQVLPSSANFVMAGKPGRSQASWYQYLVSRKIYARFFDRPHLRDYLRVTIGTPAQMNRFLQETRRYLKLKK